IAVALEPARATRGVRPVALRPRRLVVVGTGMAGLAVVEEVLRRDPDGWRVTMLGEEPGPVYNRILLSKLLAGECGPGDLAVKPVGGSRVVVLGGGLLGLEAAAGLRARGARVTVVEPAPRLMGRQLDDASAAMLESALRARGIDLRIGVLPEEITAGEVRLA